MLFKGINKFIEGGVVYFSFVKDVFLDYLVEFFFCYFFYDFSKEWRGIVRV